MDNPIIGTLVLLISDKPYAIEPWQKAISSLVIPHEKIKVVLVDTTGGGDFGLAAWQTISSLPFAKKYRVLFKQNSSAGHDHWPAYLTKGEGCAESYDKACPHIEGKLVFGLEDDITPPPEVFTELTHDLLHGAGMVGACTFDKQVGNITSVIAWDTEGKKVFLSEDEPDLKPVNAQATGCFVTWASLFKHFHFKASILDESASPDITYCRYLRREFNLPIQLRRDIHTIHTFSNGSGEAIRAGQLLFPKEYGLFFPNDEIIANADWPRKEVMLPAESSEIEASPIFLVAFTGRSGSTLLQRLLSSVSGCMIWGEPQGALAALIQAAAHLDVINRKNPVQTGRKQFKTHGYKGWIANVPPPNGTRIDILKKMVTGYYDPGDGSDWGIKAIDWDSKLVGRLYRVFPKARFIFLHRNLADVRQSYERRKGWWPEGTLQKWDERYHELMDYTHNLPRGMQAMVVDFDQYKENLQWLCDNLELFLRWEQGSIDRSLLNDKVSDRYDANRLYEKKQALQQTKNTPKVSQVQKPVQKKIPARRIR